MPKKKFYGFPILPKAGLANMLIPWAECYIWCKDKEVREISPYWRKVRIGPYLRGERDKRQYQKLFVDAGKVSGLKRIWFLLFFRRVNFEEFRFLDPVKVVSDNTIVCFSSMNYLERLVKRQAEIIEELYRITRKKFWPIGLPNIFIAIHVRLGDFPTKSELQSQVYFRQPIEWYVEVLKNLRNALGRDIPAIIFSDGTDTELAPLLGIFNVSRSHYSEAITDLLALANSTVIITSRSSFSLFGAFLGAVPSIWYKGKNEICGNGYMGDGEAGGLEIEWMPGEGFPQGFLHELKNRIGAKR